MVKTRNQPARNVRGNNDRQKRKREDQFFYEIDNKGGNRPTKKQKSQAQQGGNLMAAIDVFKSDVTEKVRFVFGLTPTLLREEITKQSSMSNDMLQGKAVFEAFAKQVNKTQGMNLTDALGGL